MWLWGLDDVKKLQICLCVVTPVAWVVVDAVVATVVVDVGGSQRQRELVDVEEVVLGRTNAETSEWEFFAFIVVQDWFHSICFNLGFFELDEASL